MTRKVKREKPRNVDPEHLVMIEQVVRGAFRANSRKGARRTPKKSSPSRSILVDTVINGRNYMLHATKGWRVRKDR